MKRAILLSVIALSACDFATTGIARPTMNGNGDLVIFDTCTRNGSNCPGKNVVEPGTYKVAGKTALFQQPVTGEVTAWADKNFAHGRVYVNGSPYGQPFEGQWVNKCEVRGRGGNSSAFILYRTDCN